MDASETALKTYSRSSMWISDVFIFLEQSPEWDRTAM